MDAQLPRLIGIVNVTPDSFSDGGRFLEPQRAIEHGRRLRAEGAQILDIGGESTRPGAEPVGVKQELERVLPVIEGLASVRATISIDTVKPAVAAAALEAGATIINDVTALSDPEMAALCAERGAEVILMHMRGTPQTMQLDPRYDDVVDDVKAFLSERIELALDAGIERRRIMVDPGIGFGKTLEHNLELLRRLGELRELGSPLVLGTSRKSFLEALTGRDVDARLGGSIASNVLGMAAGADLLRVHDVAATREAVLVATAILGRRPWRAPQEVGG